MIETFRPPPVAVATNLFTLDRLLRMPAGPRLPSRTTIVRLSDGDLVVITPPPAVGVSEAAAIATLGRVRDIVAPNSFHYVHAEDFLERFRDARLLVAPGLPDRVPQLPAHEEIDPPPDHWKGELEMAVLGPVRGISECVFFHPSTRTLVISDLAFHMVQFDTAFARIVWRASGVPASFGPSRTARTLLLGDAAVARSFLRKVVEWPFERIVMGHGDVIDDNGNARFRHAFARYIEA